ncbi:MAG: hypothetical protein ABSE40_20200 [Candidatus Sulfotelmatobacter sp.]|jgi:hypothetical protein
MASTGQARSKEAPAAILTAAIGEDVSELKKAILTRWGQSAKELGPLFSRLRSKLKAQGKKGEGFGTWLEAHGIPRSTADRWADTYEIAIGLKPAKPVSLKLGTSHASQAATFPQSTKGSSEQIVVVDTAEYIERLILVFSQEKREVFDKAEQKLRSVYGTENVSDTIYALVMERYTALTSATVATEVR